MPLVRREYKELRFLNGAFYSIYINPPFTIKTPDQNIFTATLSPFDIVMSRFWEKSHGMHTQ
jgi:hypothetical protein